MLLFLYGPDTFRSRNQMNKMIAKFKTDRDPGGLNVVISDIEKEPAEKILEEIHATPFLSEKRMVVVKGLLGSKQKKLQEMLLEKIKLQQIPASAILLFWEDGDSFKANNTVKELFALLQKEKYAQQFELLAGAKLTAFIEEQVKERGGSIQREAVEYLANNSKSNGWFIDSTINQLTAYADGRPITVADVKQFVLEKFDDNIFNLVDAITTGQKQKVFSMIEEQYKKGEDVFFVFSMLIRQFRILLMLRDLLDRTSTPPGEGLAKELGLHPFVVKKTWPLAKKYSRPELEHIYHRLLDMDIRFKTGGGKPELLLDVLVAGLCLGGIK